MTVGALCATLPVGYTTVYVGGDPYYYYGGNYYVPDSDQYRVVAPPIGATVNYLPSGAKSVVIDGVTYYELDDTWYRRFFDSSGQVIYQVVSSPLG